jgi:GTPase
MAHFGTVALIGRSNVGKSTFLNAALGEPLAIVSPTAQTTRTSLLGILHRPGYQIALVDTPGLHQPRSELGRRMNAAANEAMRTADLILFMTDVSSLEPRPGPRPRSPASAGRLIHPDDAKLLAALPPSVPVVLAINKVDRIRDKQKLLPLLSAFSALRDFADSVPLSCHDPKHVENLIALLGPRLPEGALPLDEDEMTDRPERYFVAEYIREQVLLLTSREVPHAVAVTIDDYSDVGKRILISATLHVEKDGQRKILIGKGGTMIRDIGTAARRRIQALLGRSVHLSLFVRTTPNWKDVPRQLAEMGYEAPPGSTHGTPQKGPS